MAQTIGNVLYHNLLREAAAVSWSGAIIPGFEPLNAWDWHDWSLFATELSADRYLEFITPAATINCLALYVVPFDLTELANEAIIGLALIGLNVISQPLGVCVVKLQIETGVGTGIFNDTYTIAVQGVQSTWVIKFANTIDVSNRKVRVRFANAVGSQLYVRQVAVGQALTFPIGQHVGIAPPRLSSGYVITNMPSVNGSMLSRQTRRIEKTAEIKLEPVTVDFVRDDWNPFARHASRYAFFWTWNFAEYPNDGIFAVATGVPQPENVMPTPRMRVSLPMRVID
jgi:hypothetical protein